MPGNGTEDEGPDDAGGNGSAKRPAVPQNELALDGGTEEDERSGKRGRFDPESRQNTDSSIQGDDSAKPAAMPIQAAAQPAGIDPAALQQQQAQFNQAASMLLLQQQVGAMLGLPGSAVAHNNIAHATQAPLQQLLANQENGQTAPEQSATAVAFHQAAAAFQQQQQAALQQQQAAALQQQQQQQAASNLQQQLVSLAASNPMQFQSLLAQLLQQSQQQLPPPHIHSATGEPAPGQPDSNHVQHSPYTTAGVPVGGGDVPQGYAPTSQAPPATASAAQPLRGPSASVQDQATPAAASEEVVPQHAQSYQEGGGGVTGRSPVALYIACDDDSLSEYQCVVRRQIELFEATREDIESNAQGRNRPIVLGQVGIRCKHCTMFPPKHRARGAVYYPAKLRGIYQAAQNMASAHLCDHCQHVPLNIRNELNKLRNRKSSAGGGKKYWGDGVRVLGVYEDDNCLRFESR